MITDNYDAGIGKNIKEVRNERGYSQEQLSQMSGISNSTLSSYENSRKIPNGNTLSKIARALGVSIDRLYYGDENISFINTVPDDGRKIVNCIYVLWDLGVIDYYEYFPGYHLPSEVLTEPEKNGFFLSILKYSMSIKRLINALNEYRKNMDTYADAQKYLEMIKDSVATEINLAIEKENQIRKEKAADKK